MPDAHANFAYGTVLTAPSPATSGTSLVLHSGQGALMPTPPFNAVVWATGAAAISSNAEIVRVTNVSTDTLTIVRAQESSSARSVVVGDQFAAGITAKTLTDVETGIPLVINVKDPTYGAKGDGSTDDTAAINAAINAAGTKTTNGSYTDTGNTVYFPPGNYICDSLLTGCQGSQAVVLQGAGTAYASTGTACILYTGSAGFGSQFMDFRGGEWVSLRDLSVSYTSTSFFGDLINFDWLGTDRLVASYTAGTDTTIQLVDASTIAGIGTSGSVQVGAANAPGTTFSNINVNYTGVSGNNLTGLTVTQGSGLVAPAGSPVTRTAGSGDVQMVDIRNCSFTGYNNNTQSANSLLRLNHALNTHIGHSNFLYTQYGVQLGDQNYCYGVTINDSCQFAYNVLGHILIAGGTGPITVSGNIFEGIGPKGTPGAVQMGVIASTAYGTVSSLIYHNNWHGDNSVPGSYIILGGTGSNPNNGSATGVSIAGNLFSGFTTGIGALSSTVNSGATSVAVSGSSLLYKFSAVGGSAVIGPSTAPTPAASEVFTYTGTTGSASALTLTGVAGITQTFNSGSTSVWPMSSVIEAVGTISGLHIGGNQVSTIGTIIQNTGAVQGAVVAGNHLGDTPLISSSALSNAVVSANSAGSSGVALPEYNSVPLPEAAITGTYTMSVTDRVVEANTTGDALTVTLPARSSIPLGRPIIIKDVGGDAGTNNITISRAGGDNIDGSNTLTMSTNYQCVMLYAGATEWRRIV